MAARSRFLSESRNHDKNHAFTLTRMNSHSIFGRWTFFRRRRVVLALLAIWLLYLFFKHMPTDVPPISERYDRRYGRLHPGRPDSPAWQSPGDRPVRLDSNDDAYEGPIKFQRLAGSLRAQMYAPDLKGNVLFAVSKLKNIPAILPMACSLSQHNRTRVHLAFMGRHLADWEEIRAMNGISDTDCDIKLHDARPDFSEKSSNPRLELSARASVGHFHSALQVKAVFAGDNEDAYFANALREQTSSLGLSLITLPGGAIQSLSWLSSLDAASLSYFDKVHVDIVIQAQPESSASLIRLLRSIKNADYSGWVLPRLTVEVPAKVDPFLTKYLSKFRWPASGMGGESRIVVRHRVDAKLVSPVQASMRTVESFYPLVTGESHVLLLSPGVELSPSYFQLLMYTLLEYRYGAGRSELVNHLIGVSLDLPPYAPDLKTNAPWSTEQAAEPFTFWQAPASTAALYFGDRWMAFHQFLVNRLSVDSELAQKARDFPELSHKYPAWLQPMLEMMQARDYYMLYPTFTLGDQSAAVTVHYELPLSPEEFMKDEESGEASKSGMTDFKLGRDQALTADEEIGRLMRKEKRVYSDSLVSSLLEAVGKSEETAGSHLPLMSFDGEKRQWTDSQMVSWNFAKDFATSIGGCASYEPVQTDSHDVESLFCLTST